MSARLALLARPALAAALALALCTALAPPPVAVADDAAPETLEDIERRLSETAARLEALDAEIASGRERRRALERAVAEAESRVGERRERIAGLAGEIARFDAELAELEAGVARERAGVAARRERLARTLRDAQRIDESSGLRVLLAHDDPALADRLEVYAGYLLRAQRRAIDAEVEALGRIEAAHAATLKDRNWLEYLKVKAGGQRDERVAELAARASTLATLTDELADKTRSVAELRADAARLQTLMEELRVLQSTRSGYFEAGKGRYPLPVDGEIAARFGEPKALGGLTWQGLLVRAPGGAPVRAVADGEVIYASALRGFGRLIIVDHGDDWMTLYGGNRELLAGTGSWVEAGTPIATVGDADGQRESGVYFEIRHDAEPQDPEAWLGAENRAASTPKRG